MFKTAIKTNGETMEASIINIFGITLRDSIFEWDHPNCTFEKLEEAFYKWFKIVKNNEEVFMQLRNIQHQTNEHVKVYYEHLLKLVNCLHVKTTNVLLTTIFKASLLPYLKITTIDMKRDTLIEHKEVAIVCEESGHVNLSYNVLLPTPKFNVIVKPTIFVVTTKSTSTCTNSGITSHTLETCRNWKREVPIVPISILKSTKPVETKTQLMKPIRIPI